MIILSDIQGLYTKDPKSHPDAELIHEVPAFSRELFAIAGGAGTARGTGGMYTKIQAAEICVHSGIDMIIAKSDEKEVLLRIMDGEEIGTLFRGENVHPQLKKRDIIIGTAVKGKIFVDEGCRKALLEKGSSLLPVGIIDVKALSVMGIRWPCTLRIKNWPAAFPTTAVKMYRRSWDIAPKGFPRLSAWQRPMIRSSTETISW